jgi:hypothetical protein
MLVQSLLGYLSGISILSNTYFTAGNPTEIELKNNCTGDYLTIDLSCRLVAVVTDNIKTILKPNILIGTQYAFLSSLVSENSYAEHTIFTIL